MLDNVSTLAYNSYQHFATLWVYCHNNPYSRIWDVWYPVCSCVCRCSSVVRALAFQVRESQVRVLPPAVCVCKSFRLPYVLCIVPIYFFCATTIYPLSIPMMLGSLIIF